MLSDTETWSDVLNKMLLNIICLAINASFMCDKIKQNKQQQKQTKKTKQQKNLKPQITIQ